MPTTPKPAEERIGDAWYPERRIPTTGIGGRDEKEGRATAQKEHRASAARTSARQLSRAVAIDSMAESADCRLSMMAASSAFT